MNTHQDRITIPPPPSPEEWEASFKYANTHAGEIEGCGLPDPAETKRVCDALAALVAEDAIEKLEQHKHPAESLADFIKQSLIDANRLYAETLHAEAAAKRAGRPS